MHENEYNILADDQGTSENDFEYKKEAINKLNFQSSTSLLAVPENQRKKCVDEVFKDLSEHFNKPEEQVEIEPELKQKSPAKRFRKNNLFSIPVYISILTITICIAILLYSFVQKTEESSRKRDFIAHNKPDKLSLLNSNKMIQNLDDKRRFNELKIDIFKALQKIAQVKSFNFDSFNEISENSKVDPKSDKKTLAREVAKNLLAFEYYNRNENELQDKVYYLVEETTFMARKLFDDQMMVKLKLAYLFAHYDDKSLMRQLKWCDMIYRREENNKKRIELYKLVLKMYPKRK